MNKISVIAMTIYVGYSVFQSSTLSLSIGNDYFIAVTFLLLCVNLLTAILSHKISFSLKKTDNIWKLFKPLDFVVLFFIAMNAVWMTIVPKMQGVAISQAIAEAGMLLVFILYFPLAFLIRLKEFDFKVIVKVFYYSCLILAVGHIVFWFGELFGLNAVRKFLYLLEDNPLFVTGSFIKGWGIVRVVFPNSVLLIVGLILSMAKKEKYRAWDYVCMVIFVFAILCTFLKSIWFGLAAACVICLVYSLFKMKKPRFNNIVKSFVTICIVTIILNFTVFGNAVSVRTFNAFIHGDSLGAASKIFTQTYDIFNIVSLPNISDTEDPDDAENQFDASKDIEGATFSNNIKLEQTKRLLARWGESPLIGFGYGSSLPDYLRSETQPYSYEMTFPAMLMKMGVIGFSSWIILGLAALITLLKNSKKNPLHFVIWFAIGVGLIIAVQTNPLLLSANALNLLVYLILYCVYAQRRKNEVSE